VAQTPRSIVYNGAYIRQCCPVKSFRRRELSKVLKLQREPLTRDAVQAIRDAIFAGEYKPGERMVGEDLAVSLGVSRNVVREAFWQLEAQGLIHGDDYRGKSLTTLSVAEIPLRQKLESMAVDFWQLWLQQAKAAGVEEPDSQESIYDALNLVVRWTSILDPSGKRWPG
jgi:DNA-binding GntR family transcriptional regulator